MQLRTQHSCDNMTIAVHVFLWLSASQRAKSPFEFDSYATSPNILNPICGTVLPEARKLKSHTWDHTAQKVKIYCFKVSYGQKSTNVTFLSMNNHGRCLLRAKEEGELPACYQNSVQKSASLMV